MFVSQKDYDRFGFKLFIKMFDPAFCKFRIRKDGFSLINKSFYKKTVFNRPKFTVIG